MSYRGEDLDLRTPQTWNAGAGDLASDTRGGLRNAGPIWVDDTVLAVSNHAFDVALAHRAGEVRLEHLLHALTRIEAAAEALEARGVRVAALRRESATIIASEIPVGLPNGKGAPRRSEEFGDVLRMAAANAARRNAPAGIEDLLYVLFEHAELPGLALLARHTVRPHREPETVRYVAEPRYISKPVETVRYAPESVRTYRDLAGSPTDSIQNSRLDALEQMVRALSSDLSNERQIVSSLLKDLSLQTQEQRTDQSRLQTTVADRLSMLEEVISQSRGGTGADTGLDQRISDLVRSIGKIESALDTRGVGGMMDRLSALENALNLRLNDMARSWTVLSERLQALEKTVRERPSAALPSDLSEKLRAAVDLTPLGNRLDIIEEALLSADPRSKHDELTKVLDERFKTFEAQLVRAVANPASQGSRFDQLEGSVGRIEALIGTIERQRGETLHAMMQPIVERVSSFVGNAHAQQSALGEALSKVVDRLGAVERALTAEIDTAAAKHQAYTQDLSEVHEAMMKLNQNQHTLAGSIDEWRKDAAGDLSVISNRLSHLDAENERPFETLKALSGHMDNMNKLMIERYHRRNRFWYWLFGTDDWIGASWPSQAAALENERQKFRAPKPV
jgi:predicted  nucleic acid-binding Zn-ribbon protein